MYAHIYAYPAAQRDLFFFSFLSFFRFLSSG